MMPRHPNVGGRPVKAGAPASATLRMRVTPTVRGVIEAAAGVAGESLTDFVIGAALERARSLVHDTEAQALARRADGAVLGRRPK